MSEMRIMDRQAGDLKVMWDPHNADEVTAARTQFNDLRSKGFMAYSVRKGGKRGEQITAFDPSAESIIMAPALVGG